MPGLLSRKKPREPLPPVDYYVFAARFVEGEAQISKQPTLPPRYDTWLTGSALGNVIQEPLRYEIWAEDQGIMVPFFMAPGAPLMSKQLIADLTRAGVDNLETFAAVVTETATGKVYEDYRAVNVLGVVSAADPERSESSTLGLTANASRDVRFLKKLVLDEARCHGLLMFRLAESLSALVVHRRVKEVVEADRSLLAGSLRFVHPQEYRG